MKKDKFTLRKNNVWFCDFETLTSKSKDYQKLKHTDVILVYMENYVDEKKNFMFSNLDEFFEKFIFKTKVNTQIYFHNLSFDGDFIIKYLLKNYPEKFLQKNEFNGWGFNIFKQNRRIYNILIKFENHSIYFKCTYLMLNMSISTLGKNINMLKEDKINYLIENNYLKNKQEFYNYGHLNILNDNSEIGKCFKEYCINDVKIQKKAFIDFITHINKCNFAYSIKWKAPACNILKELTITGTIKKFIKNFVGQNNSKEVYNGLFIDIKNYKFYKNWYSGGYTQFNEEYVDKVIEDTAKVYDINSSYPYVMDNNLPYGELLENKTSIDDIEWLEIEIEEIYIKKEYFNFPIFKNWRKDSIDRYIRFAKNITAYYTRKEWDIICKVYNVKIKNIKSYYTKSANFLKEYIDELYHLKQTEKNNYSYKIFLNATYGLFAMREQYDSEYLIDGGLFDEMKEQKLKEINIDNELYDIIHYKNNYFFNTNYKIIDIIPKVSKKKRALNILIASYITSMARCNLFENILKNNINDWLYADTDSIFIKGNKHNINIGDKLGQWKEEATLIKGKILGAKKYYFYQENGKTKLGLSGINNLENLTFDEFRDKAVINDAQNYIKNDEYGIIIATKDLIINKGNI